MSQTSHFDRLLVWLSTQPLKHKVLVIQAVADVINHSPDFRGVAGIIGRLLNVLEDVKDGSDAQPSLSPLTTLPPPSTSEDGDAQAPANNLEDGLRFDGSLSVYSLSIDYLGNRQDESGITAHRALALQRLQGCILIPEPTPRRIDKWMREQCL
jgi:hypothetical protein